MKPPFRINIWIKAQVLADDMIGFFADPAGGFYMTASDAESLIIRPKEAYDGALPSGNSVAALVLFKLHALTKKENYITLVKALLEHFTSSIAQAPYAYCFLLSVLDRYLHGPLEITFKGAVDDPTISKMLKVLYKHYVPTKIVQFIPSADKGQVQLCFRGTCQRPIDSVEAFEQELI